MKESVQSDLRHQVSLLVRPMQQVSFFQYIQKELYYIMSRLSLYSYLHILFSLHSETKPCIVIRFKIDINQFSLPGS